MLNLWTRNVIGPRNSDHIKAGRVLEQIVRAQESQRRASNSSLLVSRDRFRGMPRSPISTRFDFDKDNRFAIDRNEINLAELDTILARHNPVALAP